MIDYHYPSLNPDCVQPSGLKIGVASTEVGRLDFFVNHCLDAVAVGIEDESSEIILTIFSVYSGSAIITSTVFQRRPIKSGDRLSRWRPEGNVEALIWHV